MRSPAAQNRPAQHPTAIRCIGSIYGWGGLLIVLVFLFYLPVFRCGFIDFDDPDYVVQNTHVLGGLTGENLAWAFRSLFLGFWQPLTWLSYMVDVSLYGPGPMGFHFTNVLLHALNGALVLLLLHKLTGALGRSLLVAFFFALHPLRVESVAWVTERKDVLSTCFGLLSLLLYAEWHAANGKGQKYYLGALLCFALGLMSKPMLVTLPCVMLLLDYWPLQRMQNWGRLLLEKVPFLVLSAAASAVTLWAHGQAKGVYSLTALPLSLRLENAAVAYLRYLGKAFWPVNLAVYYPHPGHWPRLLVGSAVLVLTVITMAAWLLRRRNAFGLMGWLWFLGVLVPVSGLMQAGGQAMADRFTYLPSVGLFIALVWGADALRERFHWPVMAWGCLMLGLMLACAFRTSDQLRHWRDSGTIFAHAAKVTDNNFVVIDNLGGWYLKQHQPEEALAQFQRALAINPDYPESLNNVGTVLMDRNQPAEAAQYFARALAANPHMAPAMNNLGNALRETDPAGAVRWLEAAVREQPDYATARFNLGALYEKLGRGNDAIEQYNQAVRLEPGNMEIWNSLANALARAGRLDEAVTSYQRALQINPGDPKVHSNLGGILSLQGKLDEAIVQYTDALRLRPEHVGAHNNLGLALLKVGQPEAAEAQFREAVRLAPGLAIVHCNLGRALAQLHRNAEAADAFREALRLDPNQQEAAQELKRLTPDKP